MLLQWPKPLHKPVRVHYNPHQHPYYVKFCPPHPFVIFRGTGRGNPTSPSCDSHGVEYGRVADVQLSDILAEAKAALEAGDLNRTALLCRHIFRYYPRCVEAARVLGEAYADQRTTAEADTLFQFVLRADPHDTLGYVDRGFIAAELHRLDEAITFFERALELDPNIGQLRTELLNLYKERDGRRARLRISKAGLANQRFRDGFTAQAIEEFGAILRETPDRLDVRVHLAEAHWRVRDYARTEILARDLLRMNADLVKPHYLLWHIAGLPDRRNRDEAATHLRAAQALDPTHLVAERLFADTAPDALDYLKNLPPATLPQPGTQDESAADDAAVAFEGVGTTDLRAVDRQLGLAPAVPLPPEPPAPALLDEPTAFDEDDWLASLMAETAAAHHVDVQEVAPVTQKTAAGSWLLDDDSAFAPTEPQMAATADADAELPAFAPFDLAAPNVEQEQPEAYLSDDFVPFDPAAPATIEPDYAGIAAFDPAATTEPAPTFEPATDSAILNTELAKTESAEATSVSMTTPEVGAPFDNTHSSAQSDDNGEYMPTMSFERRDEMGQEPREVQPTESAARRPRIRSGYARHERGERPPDLLVAAPVRTARLASDAVRDEAGTLPTDPRKQAKYRDEKGTDVSDLSGSATTEPVSEALGLDSTAEPVAAAFNDDTAAMAQATSPAAFDEDVQTAIDFDDLPIFDAEAATAEAPSDVDMAELVEIHRADTRPLPDVDPRFDQQPHLDLDVAVAPITYDAEDLPPYLAGDPDTAIPNFDDIPAFNSDAATVEETALTDFDDIPAFNIEAVTTAEGSASADLAATPAFDRDAEAAALDLIPAFDAGVAATAFHGNTDTEAQTPVPSPPPWLADAPLPSLDVEDDTMAEASRFDFDSDLDMLPTFDDTGAPALTHIPTAEVVTTSAYDDFDLSTATANDPTQADLDLNDLPDSAPSLDLSDLPDFDAAALPETAAMGEHDTAEAEPQLRTAREPSIAPRSERGDQPAAHDERSAFARRSERGEQPAAVDEHAAFARRSERGDEPAADPTPTESTHEGLSAAEHTDGDLTDDSHEAAVQRLDSEEEQEPMPISKKGNDNEPEENLFDWEREELPDYLRPFAVSVDDASKQPSAQRPPSPQSRAAQAEPQFDLSGGDALPSWLNDQARPTPPPAQTRPLGANDMARVDPNNRGATTSGGSALPSWLDNADFDEQPPAAPRTSGGNTGLSSVDDFDFDNVQPFDVFGAAPQPRTNASQQAARPAQPPQNTPPPAFPTSSPFNDMPIGEVDDLSVIQPFSPDDFQDVFGGSAPPAATPPRSTQQPQPARPAQPPTFQNPGFDDDSLDLPSGMMPFDPSAMFGAPAAPPQQPPTSRPAPARPSQPSSDFDDFDTSGDFGNLAAFDPSDFGGTAAPKPPAPSRQTPPPTSRPTPPPPDDDDIFGQLTPFGAPNMPTPQKPQPPVYDPGDPFSAFTDNGGGRKPNGMGLPGMDAFTMPDQNTPQGFTPFTGKLSDIAGTGGASAASNTDDFDFEGSLAPFNFTTPDTPRPAPTPPPSRPRQPEETPGGGLLRGLDKRRREAERDRAEQAQEGSLFARMAARRHQQDASRPPEPATPENTVETVESIPTIAQLDAQLDGGAAHAAPVQPPSFDLTMTPQPPTPIAPIIPVEPMPPVVSTPATPVAPTNFTFDESEKGTDDFEFQDFFSDEAEAAPPTQPARQIDLSDTGEVRDDDLFAPFELDNLRQLATQASPSDNFDDFDAIAAGTVTPQPEEHHGILHNAVEAVKSFVGLDKNDTDANETHAAAPQEQAKDEFDFGDDHPFNFDAPLTPVPPLVQQPTPQVVAPVVPDFALPVAEPIAPKRTETRLRPEVAEPVATPAQPQAAATPSDVLAQAKANPRDTGANTAAAAQLMVGRQYEEAIEHYLRVVRSLDKSQAQDLLDRLQSIAPQFEQNARFHRLMGDTYQKLGQSHWAVSEYSKALQLGKARR